MNQKPEVTFEDFSKLDIRTGTIIEVNDFPQARVPSFQLTIDFGKLGIKRSSAQITILYTKEQLLNRQIIAIVNFKPKQIANFFSECLVLGIVRANQEIVLLQTPASCSNGNQIS